MTAQPKPPLQRQPPIDAGRVSQPLRGRLPALRPEQAKLLRDLFGSAREFGANNALRLSIVPPGALPRELVECEAGSERLLIGIVRDGIVDPCGGGAWNDYIGPGRCAAWTLAHERLLDALSDLFGQPLLPRTLLAAGSSAPGMIWIGLRASVEQTEALAVLALPLTLAQALGEGLRIRGTRREPTPRIDADSWREMLLLTARGPALSVADIAGLGPGDVIVLGPRPQVLTDLHLGRGRSRPTARWHASWHAGRLQVRGLAATDYSRSSPVNDTPSANGAPETGAATVATPSPPSIPVTLEFELGAIDASLRDIAQIEPGYVFDLPLQLDHAAVTIRSGSRRVGRGELVAVGDTLGVRLTEWCAEGS